MLAQKGYNISHSLEYIALSFIGYPLGALLSVPLIEKIDRKWLVSASAFGMGVFGILFGMGTIASMIIVFGFIYTLCSNIFSNAFHVLQAEIFPTEIRATATGAAYSVSRLMSGLMPFILLPVLEHQGATTMFAIVALAMIIVILDISLLAPRTTGVHWSILKMRMMMRRLFALMVSKQQNNMPYHAAVTKRGYLHLQRYGYSYR